MFKALSVFAATALLVACAATEPVAPFQSPGPRWPPPPDPARLQLVQTFAGPDDLGIRPSVWDRMKAVVSGPAELRMVRPMAVAASSDGQVVFVADPDARCVHRFDLRHGRYVCLQTEDGQGLASPVGLAVDPHGRLFVADSALDGIFATGADGETLRPVVLSPPPVQPTGVAVHPLGDLFVASTATHSVRRYDTEGRRPVEYGGRGSRPGEMNYPTYLWLAPPSELLVTDTMNFRIQRFDAEDGVLGIFGQAGDGTGSMSRPKGVAMDRHGHIYVVDGMHHAMQIFDREGRLLLAVGEQGQAPGQFWLPSGIFVTEEGLVFVADAYNGRVQVFRYLEEAS